MNNERIRTSQRKSKGSGNDISSQGWTIVDLTESLVRYVTLFISACLPSHKPSSLSNIHGLIATVNLYYPEYLFP